MSVEIKRDDRRVCRTRRSLSRALVELMMEKRYTAITVQDVIDRADVGRSTFYAHYRDKEDLFLSQWKRLLDWFAAQIEWEKGREGRFIPVEKLFQHVQESQSFYKALARSGKVNLIFKTGVDYLSESIESGLTSFLAKKPRPSVPIPVLSNYIASEVIAQLKWWADHNMPYSPERMDEIFHELVAPGLRLILSRDDSKEREQV